MLGGASAFAAELDDSGIWEYQATDGGIELIGYKGTQTDVYIPSKIEVKDEFLSVRKLGDNLFKENSGINSATLGDGIIEIGASAFENAANLVCIVTPESLTTIGANAFFGCSSFNSIILYDAVTAIGENAFADCPKVKIYCNENNTGYLYAVANNIPYVILNPDATPEIYTVDGIEYYIMNGEAIAVSFDGNTTDVVVPPFVEGYPVTQIRTIFKSTEITSISLPDSIKFIETAAFENCKKLVKIKMSQNITKINDKAFYCCYNLKDITIPDNVNYIGSYAFAECQALTSIFIPSQVTRIENYTFNNCVNLVTAVLPDNLKYIGFSSFYNCKKLTEIVIPDTVTDIMDSAFGNCSSLMNLTISGKVEILYPGVFSNCSSLETVVIPNSVKTIYDSFTGCISLTQLTFSNNLTTINDRAFENCKKLSKINLPNTLTTIGYRSFYNCVELNEITLSNSIEIIGKQAFGNCKNIISVYLYESLKSIYIDSFSNNVIWIVEENSYAHTFAVNNAILYYIPTENNPKPEIYIIDGISYFISGNEATAYSCDTTLNDVNIPNNVNGYNVTKLFSTFSGCTNLVNVTLPSTLITIGYKAFYKCTALSEVILPENVVEIGDYAFSGCTNLKGINIQDKLSIIGENAFSSAGLTEVSLPDSVLTIGAYAFSGCGLKKVTLSENITSISNGLFAGCSSLLSISIPDKVTAMGGSAFNGCKSMRSAELPEGLQAIGDYAFYNCEMLNSIKIPDKVEEIGYYTFYNCKRLKDVKLPENLKKIWSYAFYKCIGLTEIIIPEGTTGIWSDAFGGCSALLTIWIPDSIQEFTTIPTKPIWVVNENSAAHIYAKEKDLLYAIGKDGTVLEIIEADGIKYLLNDDGAVAFEYIGTADNITIPEQINEYPVIKLRYTFANNKNIKSVSIPDTVVSLTGAFSGCTSLTKIVIPNSVVSLNSTFSGCTNLTEINIPDSVTSLNGTFFGCTNLKDINIPDSVVSISGFNGAGITKITIPYSVTMLGNGAFMNCVNLEEAVILGEITTLGSNCFRGCKNLKKVQLPDSIITIDSCAFQDCSSLVKINMPQNLKTIYQTVFMNCNELEMLTIPDGVTRIDHGVFPATTILCVEENSYAHTFAVKNNLLYFIIPETENPQISYGSGISGTVTYTDSAAASNATVEILYDDGTVKETVTTDANGSYEFTYAEVGRYTIKVTDESGSIASEVVSVKRMNVFDVFLSGETNLVLKKGYSVSGKVNVATATVTLTDGDGNVIEVTEAVDGAYEFTNVPNGEYIIKAESENGSVSKEVTVFGGNVTLDELIIVSESATVTGYVEVEDRDFKHHRRNWVHVTIYNADGVAIDSGKTDADGKYTFTKLPMGDYSIVAETAEMRPDKKHGYDRSHTLTGYTYVSVTEAITYELDTIVLYEENDCLATVSGKVTAQGETQDCEVILKNVFRHEVAKMTTGNNGKYTFKNVRDGLYFVTAITKSDGMGFCVIVVRDGKVYGETDIFVYKHHKIYEYEENMRGIPQCLCRDDALKHKDKIREHKKFYDGLSEKEKKQFSKEYTDRLNKLSEWIADCEYTENGGHMKNGGLIISEEEIEDEERIEFVLNVEKKDKHEKSVNGVENGDDFIQHSIEDTAGDRELAQYYDITLTKNGKKISDVRKHTDTTGKLRITLDIPAEYRGHKHYSFVHVHNGEVITLTDLDDNPYTVTFEIDRFSTFALCFTDEALTEENENTANIMYSEETGKISVSSDVEAKLYIATYDGNVLVSVEGYDISSDTVGAEYDFKENQKAFIWNESFEPLCEAYEIS